jgi:hypothetical protein
MRVNHRPEKLCALFLVVVTILVLPSTSSVSLLSQALVMSQTTTTAEVSSRFQAIFQAALSSYQKQTKTDLLAHPLASHLKSCGSTTAIVAILQDQLRDLDKSRIGDERLTKWLSPTVNVLSAFSAIISGGVSLVSLDTYANVILEASSDVCLVGMFACECHFYRHRCPRFSKYYGCFPAPIVLTLEIL